MWLQVNGECHVMSCHVMSCHVTSLETTSPVLSNQGVSVVIRWVTSRVKEVMSVEQGCHVILPAERPIVPVPGPPSAQSPPLIPTMSIADLPRHKP